MRSYAAQHGFLNGHDDAQPRVSVRVSDQLRTPQAQQDINYLVWTALSSVRCAHTGWMVHLQRQRRQDQQTIERLCHLRICYTVHCFELYDILGDQENR